MPQTNYTEDLEWLFPMVDDTSSYPASETSYLPYKMVDENVSALSVCIVGNVVFLKDHTIAIVSRIRLEQPDSLINPANVANEAAVRRLHSHLSIPCHIFLSCNLHDWSMANSFNGPETLRWRRPTGTKVRGEFSRLCTNHRWLPLVNEQFDYTPVGMSVYRSWPKF
ncbi:hypothetical protein BDV11DRAFT_195753 [Aspergillus similis]